MQICHAHRCQCRKQVAADRPPDRGGLLAVATYLRGLSNFPRICALINGKAGLSCHILLC
jgi:hypothetical protein